MIRSHFWNSFAGHPAMAVCHLLGLRRAGDWIHDSLFVEPPPAAIGRRSRR